MSDRLLAIVPTRGRPDRLEAFLETWHANTTDADLLIRVDNDDPELERYCAMRQVMVIGPRVGLARSYDEIAAGRPARAYALLGDDVAIRTPGWDRIVLEALDDGAHIVYGDDGLQGEHLATLPTLSSTIVEALGWVTPPPLEHNFIDNFWTNLGRATGTLRYLPNLELEHLHPAVGKAEWDATYEAASNEDAFNADHEEWVAFLDHGEFDAAVDRCRRALEELSR